MTMTFIYTSPSTPAGAGWNVDLGQQFVRLASVTGLITEAQLGAVGISSLTGDDPTGTAGHDNDAILGLKQFYVEESEAPSGNRRIWTGYIGDRRYRRGSGDSLRLGPARVIDITMVDINTFLTFRRFQPTVLDDTSSFKRLAETDIERIAAMLDVDFLSTTLQDGGLVNASDPVDMGAVDYTGQTPADVLNDCAQQSGKNYFIYLNEGAGDYELFYDFNDSMVYTSTLQVSNVTADVDNTTTFYPLMDAELQRDPSRVAAGVLIQADEGAAYENDLDTSYVYGYRDVVGDSMNVRTTAQAVARAQRVLAENATEDDQLTFSVQLPRANVNDWREGQAAQVRFQHLPGYEDFRWVRAIRRTVSQIEDTQAFFTIAYDCHVMPLE